MAWLPLDPVYSKALILANQFNCLEEMLIAVSMLSVEFIFYNPCEKSEEWPTTDLVDLVNNNTQAFWLDEMTLMQSEYSKNVFHKGYWQSSSLSTYNIFEHLDHYRSRYD
ncbi:PREDICTED: pre-mRNA-splicing factor ATP-dependent RNA helicase PRP16-like [Populus euphratica]|uniref:Pre-mRNA-splicing factor ATP-dependent RNA helicase PRP16-like n=1 Tax=Populus euphratica TaxID=75702 RepID=A0AAJ6TSL9_POPEU|nr:PREDICTED: pre-mRNA-splicing factor ATP-dependent RNA helicase PRP16-like [Populus euphratica]